MTRVLPASVRRGSDGVALATRGVIAKLAGRHPELVSRHCRPVACDVRTRALLYDADAAFDLLDRRRKTSSPCQRKSFSSTVLPAGDVCP